MCQSIEHLERMRSSLRLHGVIPLISMADIQALERQKQEAEAKRRQADLEIQKKEKEILQQEVANEKKKMEEQRATIARKEADLSKIKTA